MSPSRLPFVKESAEYQSRAAPTDLDEGGNEGVTITVTGVFDVDRIHSSFQFAVRHMKIATFRASFRDVDARLIADASELRLEGAARVESISIADPPEFRDSQLHLTA